MGCVWLDLQWLVSVAVAHRHGSIKYSTSPMNAFLPVQLCSTDWRGTSRSSRTISDTRLRSGPVASSAGAATLALAMLSATTTALITTEQHDHIHGGQHCGCRDNI